MKRLEHKKNAYIGVRRIQVPSVAGARAMCFRSPGLGNFLLFNRMEGGRLIWREGKEVTKTILLHVLGKQIVICLHRTAKFPHAKLLNMVVCS